MVDPVTAPMMSNQDMALGPRSKSGDTFTTEASTIRSVRNTQLLHAVGHLRRYCYNIAMNRLHKFAFGICLTILATGALVKAGTVRSVHWTKIPSVTVVSAAGDSRLEAVRDAIAFWNRTFADIGTPFRLGNVAFVIGTIPDEDI